MNKILNLRDLRIDNIIINAKQLDCNNCGSWNLIYNPYQDIFICEDCGEEE